MSDFQVVILVGPKDCERLSELATALTDETIVHCRHLDTLEGIAPLIDQLMPDLVLLDADSLENKGESIDAFATQLRQHTSENRPVLVIQTGGAEARRIEYLTKGADDILPDTLSLEERRIRLLVHLRRNLEALSHPVTQIPGMQFAAKVLQRRVNRQESWALLVVDIDHFNVYTEVYGPIPRDQVLRTFTAMLAQYVLIPDFVGHTDNNFFLIITSPEKAEKISGILCRQFDTTVPNFYSEKDRKQGYIISILEHHVSRRIPLLNLSVGIVTSDTQQVDSFMAAYNAAIAMKDIAKLTPGSSFHTDKPKLAGQPTTITPEQFNVLAVESDAAMAFLLKTTLEMQGYDVETVSSPEEAMSVMQNKKTQLVILDSLLHGEPTGLALSTNIRKQYPDTSILCISTLHNREQVLQAGADLYLPKPFDMIALFSWIERLLKGTQ